MEGFLEPRAVCDDPAVNRRVLQLHPTFCHECFDVARAQQLGHTDQRPLMRMTSWGTCVPLKLIAIASLPQAPPVVMEGEHTANRVK
jgi:hypothetical protein